MMNLDEITSYKDVGAYLTEQIDKADNRKSAYSPRHTRLNMWEVWMSLCVNNSKKKLSEKQVKALMGKIRKDF